MMNTAGRSATITVLRRALVIVLAVLAVGVRPASSIAGGDQAAGCFPYEPAASDAAIVAMAAQIRDGSMADAELTAAVKAGAGSAAR